MALAPMLRLGPYEILAPLGAGGMGEVYRARDTRLDRPVAIKILPPQFGSDPVRKQRFDREAKTISHLNHPHICVLHDIGHQDGVDYLVMEYLEGETLAKRLEKGPLPLEQVLRFGAQLADGLDKAHRSGVVHRDLKPGNIMLTPTGAKLLDFGLAKPVSPLVSGSTMTFATQPAPVTEQGAIVGTFQYMAPEQVEGEEADARSDIFALGAVLYEMATGRRAFEGKTPASAIAAVLERDPPPISAIQRMSPPALDQLVQTCLAKDPDERFQNVHDVKWQLNWIAQASALPAVTKRKARDNLVWILAAASTILCLALVGSIYFRPRVFEANPVFGFIPPPPGTHFVTFGFGSGPVVVSPDESQLAFSAIDQDGMLKLWVRPLKSHEARVVPGTENGAAPFWAPDGRSLGFFADGKLKTVDLSNGAIQVLTDSLSFSTGV